MPAADPVGRLVFTSRYSLTVLPVHYKMFAGTVMFRTAHNSATDEDLRTGRWHDRGNSGQ